MGDRCDVDGRWCSKPPPLDKNCAYFSKQCDPYGFKDWPERERYLPLPREVPQFCEEARWPTT